MGSVTEVGVDTLSLRTWHVDVGMNGKDAEKKGWMPKPRTGAGTTRFYERGMPRNTANTLTSCAQLRSLGLEPGLGDGAIHGWDVGARGAEPLQQ